MSIFADTRQTTARFGHYIEALRLLFRTHSINFGSIEEVFQFEPRLASDEALRNDFAALVSAIGAEQNGNLSITEILTITAIALGGTDIDQKEREISAPISTLVIFLAGVGGWKTAQSRSSSPTLATPDRIVHEPAETDLSSASQSIDLATQVDAAGDQAMKAIPVDDSFHIPPRMQEILDRLELNGVQLKLYLDDIDRRMGRIEPHIEDITSAVHSSAQYFQGLKPERSQSAGHLSESGSKQDRELIPQSPIHIPKRASPPVIPIQDPVQASVSTDTLKQKPVSAPLHVAPPGDAKRPNHSRRAATAAFIALLVITAGALAYLYFNRYNASRGQPNSSAIHASTMPNENAPYLHPDPSATTQSKAEATLPVVTHAQDVGKASPAPTQPTHTAATGTTASNTAMPARAALTYSQPPPKLPRQAASVAQTDRQGSLTPTPDKSVAPPLLASKTASPLAGAAPSGTEPTRSVAPNSNSPSPSGTQRPVRTETASLRDASAPIVRSAPPSQRLEVSSPFMTANLLFAPKPAYPPDAIFHRVEGEVVLHAAISKSGSVESLQVVSGPVGLRQTSLATVRNWRFKPFMVNGAPIEVGTTLHVVFHLQ